MDYSEIFDYSPTGERTITVGAHWFHWIGWVTILFFGILFLCCGFSESWSLALMFLPWIVLGAVFPICIGKVILNEFGVHHQCPLGSFYIPWDEVETIESGNGNFVIGNPKKRVSMLEPGYWTGEQREFAIIVLYEIASLKGITIEERGRATFQFSKNSRVRRK